MDENTNINVSKHIYFSKEFGKFYLTSEAQEIIYRQKNLICSYSGSCEWANHFVCEMIDFCSGSSPYNFALNSICHEKEMPQIWKENKESIIDFIEKSTKTGWSIKMYELIDSIIDESLER